MIYEFDKIRIGGVEVPCVGRVRVRKVTPPVVIRFEVQNCEVRTMRGALAEIAKVATEEPPPAA